jgi:hypothetical protein
MTMKIETCSSAEAVEDFWKVLLNEPDEDSRGEKRGWFFSRKGHQKRLSDGESYEDQRDDSYQMTETLETKVERAFDSIFYDPIPSENKPLRFNWFRKGQSVSERREEEKMTNMTIFAPPAPSTKPPPPFTAERKPWFWASKTSEPTK